MHPSDLATLDAQITQCRACPRLVEWRESVAQTKRAAFADQTYWGRPVPAFGPPDAPMLIIGLAPAAHGANRTGRMFTGDRSGDFLFKALHEVGLASQPTSTSPKDGLELYGVRITSAVHCAPPTNKPTPGERDTCRSWLVQELHLLRPSLRSVVLLGAFAWQSALPALAEAGWTIPRPRPPFAHGTRLTLRVRPEAPAHDTVPLTAHGASASEIELFGVYHVSQQNTFTGRLTQEMLQTVLRSAAQAADVLPR